MPEMVGTLMVLYSISGENGAMAAAATDISPKETQTRLMITVWEGSDDDPHVWQLSRAPTGGDHPALLDVPR